MSGDVEDYFSQIDRLLAVSRTVFPEGEPARSFPSAAGVEVAGPPDTAGLNEPAGLAAAEYQRAAAHLAAVGEAIGNAVAEAAAQGQQGQDAATAIQGAARSQLTAMAPAASSHEGPGQIVSVMDGHLAAMQAQIRSTRERLAAAADRVLRHSAELGDIVGP